MKKRQVNFYIPEELFKQFSKRAIDIGKSKTLILKELIEKFLKN